jgi:hypothetical protein
LGDLKANFSWSGAALAGFGVLRREPGILLPWSLVGLVFGLADQVLDARAESLRAAGYSATWIVPGIGLVRAVIAIVAMAIFSAAVYRAVLRPQGEARGRMRFGRDEVRLTLLWMSQGLLLLVMSILAVIPAFVLSTMMPRHDAMATGTVGTISALGIVIAWIGMLARLSPAAPMALAEGRWSVRAAWGMTRGHFWKTLAVYLPVLLGLGLVFSVSNTLYGLILAATHVDFSPADLLRSRSLAEVFSPVRLGLTILTAILGAAAAAILYAPAAVIYRDLKGDEPADQAAVFD